MLRRDSIFKTLSLCNFEQREEQVRLHVALVAKSSALPLTFISCKRLSDLPKFVCLKFSFAPCFRNGQVLCFFLEVLPPETLSLCLIKQSSSSCFIIRKSY